MPVENEIKYVVKQSLEERMMGDSLLIEQAYLTKNPTTRIRHIQEVSRGIDSTLRGVINTFKFTFKHFINEELIEIETNIDKDDFYKLWPYTFNQVRKHRYVLKNNDEHWDIDFLKDKNDKTYFALAEVEMPEGREKPNEIPAIIESKILYRVGRLWSKEFSNIKLSDIELAVELYAKLEKDYALHKTY